MNIYIQLHFGIKWFILTFVTIAQDVMSSSGIFQADKSGNQLQEITKNFVNEHFTIKKGL